MCGRSRKTREAPLYIGNLATHPYSFRLATASLAGAEKWSSPVFGGEVPHPKELGHEA